MDIAAIFAVVAKGLSIIETVAENKDLVISAVGSIKHIVEHKATVTKSELEAVEANLDAMLDEFNSDLPFEG